MRSPRHRRRLYSVALMALLALADADAETLCTSNACSNDAKEGHSLDEGIYGDELLIWSGLPQWQQRECPDQASPPCVTDANRRCYEVALFAAKRTMFRLCESTVWRERAGRWLYRPPPTAVPPYKIRAWDFPRQELSYRYVVRACEGDRCGPWAPQDESGAPGHVEFVGGLYACFGAEGGRCEKSCYPGAPKRYAEIPDCEEPY